MTATKMTTTGVTAALAMLILITGRPSSVSGQTDDVKINTFVESVMQNFSVPGLSLSVVHNGKVFMSKGYGSTRLDSSGVPVTEDTLFFLASTTKAMTATLLAQILADSPQYNLDTPVRVMMPDFHLSELYIQQHTTVRDILSHRVGITDNVLYLMLGDVANPQEVVERVRFMNPQFPFRTSYYYNNMLYTTAGQLVENITSPSVTWEDAMRDHIFTPLGMNDTTYIYELSAEQRNRLATPYEREWRNKMELREVSSKIYESFRIEGGSAGAVVSSARDLSKWLMMLTNEGRNERGEQVIDSAVLKSTMQPYSIMGPQQGIPPFNSTAETYDLGWITGFYRGNRMVSHSGELIGYSSLVTVYPDLKLAIMTCNNGGKVPYSEYLIHDYITPLLMPGSDKNPSANEELINGLKLLNNNTHVDQFNFTDSSAPETNLTEYLGIYGSFAAGNITVTRNETTSRLESEYGTFTRVDMVQNSTNADNFMGLAADPLWFSPPIDMRFGRNEQGQVHTLTMSIFLLDYPLAFVKGLKMSDAPPPLEEPECKKSN